MIEDLTMLANLPVVDAAVAAKVKEVSEGPEPSLPKSPEQPVLPPDDPRRPDLDREPEGDPPSTEPPVTLPSEHPGLGEPPSPRASTSCWPTSAPA
jgi:hypothetical protein